MKRLVKSRQTGIFCTQCDKSIPVNTSRIIDGGMHSHYECLNKGKVMGEWVSVDDNLPKKTGNVLCCNAKNGVVATGLYLKYIDGGGKWGDSVNNLTHWMLLPEPPKE
jgi:hypothetical protein